jgi:hypothetical protein
MVKSAISLNMGSERANPLISLVAFGKLCSIQSLSAWQVIMYSLSRSMSRLTLSLAVAVALLSTCLAQEVASLDVTKIERVPLRRPAATSSITGGYRGTERGYPCRDSAQNGGALRASVSLDRTHYQVGETFKFEVTVENAGSVPIKIPFSPQLADLQPKDPAQKFSYSKLQIVLWIAGGDHWGANSAGFVALYGADDHPGTMLLLDPGQWARIIGEGKVALPNPNAGGADVIRLHPADRIYAEASVYREETLITPTVSDRRT